MEVSQELLYGNDSVIRNWERPPVNHQWGIEVSSPSAGEELNPPNNHANELVYGPFTVKPSDKTTVPYKTLIAVSWKVLS
jgi:hypothetical protein